MLLQDLSRFTCTIFCIVLIHFAIFQIYFYVQLTGSLKKSGSRAVIIEKERKKEYLASQSIEVINGTQTAITDV